MPWPVPWASDWYEEENEHEKGQYSNAEVDELCAQGVATTDEAARESAYIEAQKIIIDESPNLFFASPMEYFFVSSGVEGFEPFAANANNFRTTYIAE